MGNHTLLHVADEFRCNLRVVDSHMHANASVRKQNFGTFGNRDRDSIRPAVEISRVVPDVKKTHYQFKRVYLSRDFYASGTQYNTDSGNPLAESGISNAAMSPQQVTANGINGHDLNGNGINTSTSPSIGTVNTVNGASMDDSDACHVDTDFLVVGCGPAGASLACFLGSHGAYMAPSAAFG